MATLNFPDDPSTGDVYTDGNSGFSYEWNGTVWISTDPSTVSNIREIDDISGDFDGSDTTFTLKVSGVNVEPANAQQLIVSVGGVMQNAGQDFTVSGAVITFTTAPSSGLTFFGVLLGTALSLNTIPEGGVTPASLTTTSNYVMNGLTLDQGAGIITAFGFQGGSITADLDSTFAANVSIAGSLTVQGTQTIINTDELNVQDKTIGIGSTNAPSSTTQDGAGAIIYGQTHIDILYDRDKAALGISTAVSVTGFVTATGALKAGTGSTITGVLYAESFSGALASWTLGADGSSHYTFDGPGLTGAENDPTIYLQRGKRYNFVNASGGHPFRIQSDPNGSSGTAYNDGVTNNDAGNGTTLEWDVQFDAPNVLYYQCTSHANMGGKIYIGNSGDSAIIGTGVTINNTGINISGIATVGSGLSFVDGVKAQFGSSGDLSIYHDASHSYIQDAGTGNLYLRSNGAGVVIDDGSATFARFLNGNACDFNFNGTKRLETASDDAGGGIIVTGKIVGTAATIGTGVTINNTGIDAGSAGIITAGTISSPSELSFDVAGSTETFRIEASEVGIGTINPNEQLTIYSKTSGPHGIRLQHSTGATGVGIVNDGSGLVLRNYNSSRRFAFVNGDVGIGTTTAQGVLHVAGVGGDTYADVYLSNDTSGHTGSDGANIFLNNSLELGVWNKEAGPIRFATSGSERLRITSGGGFSFNNAQLVERVEITAGKLSDNVDIDLADGMVHYFTTQESTTSTPNLRIDGSTTLNSAMDAGDVITVTLITTAAAAGYSANLNIDGNSVTEEWVGGAAPSEGGADGLDIYSYTVICTHATNTGDSGFKVIANLTNATN